MGLALKKMNSTCQWLDSKLQLGKKVCQEHIQAGDMATPGKGSYCQA